MNNASDDVSGEVNDLLQKKDFGSVLRKAREKQGMSANDVAENLLISVEIIKAIDNSQADALPALTFTQGYIRSYARLLGLSADDIITEYVLMAPDSKQVLTPHSVLPAQKSSNDSFMKLISFSFIIVAIIVLFVWLYNADFRNFSNSVNNDAAEFNSPVNAENEPVLHVDESDVNLINEQQEDSFQSDENEQVESLELNVKPDVLSAPEVEAIVDVEDVIAEESAPVISLGEDKLLLSALGESWCEIQDSTGKRMFYQLLNRGQEVSLSGVAPFTVFLGNAPEVRVEVNNKIVDFESLINRSSNIASIEISKDASVVSLSNR